MATILNLAIMDSATLFFPLKLTHACQDWFPPFAQKRLHSHFPPHHLHKKYFTHSFWLNLMMAAILNSSVVGLRKLHSSFWLNLMMAAILNSSVVGLRKLHSSFWLNLMMVAILNSAMLDSDTLFSSLRFTQKHSPSTLTLTQTNLIWLKLFHSHSTWWWQPSWFLPSWISPSWIQPP